MTLVGSGWSNKFSMRSDLVFNSNNAFFCLLKNGISKRMERLVFEIHSVMIEAIDAGGSTLQDFRGVDGDDALGYFPNSFMAYGREGKNCLKKSCDGTIKRIIQSNRSTFFCPKCQR